MYTSQRCNKCGNINKEKRDVPNKGQEVFEYQTKECNHKTNADLNAIRNIAMVGIEDIIKNQIEAQKNQ